MAATTTTTHRRAATTVVVAGAAVREVLSTEGRSKLDPSSDREFYSVPRFVHHLDEGFRARLTQLYRERLPSGPDAALLDLCSSWVSHLPPEATYGRVVGHGLNAAELARNKRLNDFFVRDLNAQPDGWALPDASLDAVTVCAGVQYLQQPERVMAEVRRVLKPGGVLIVSFSNRMFYSKAVAAWRDSTMFGRAQLVVGYLSAAGGFERVEVVRKVELPAAGGGGGGESSGGGWAAGLLRALPEPIARLVAARGEGDPFCAVVAYKQGGGGGGGGGGASS